MTDLPLADALRRLAVAGGAVALPAEYDRLTVAQKRWARDEYARLQGGKCRYCLEPLSGPASNLVRSKRLNKKRFPKDFFAFPHHLHHDHRNGMTLGTVHALCNAVLWTYHGE